VLLTVIPILIVLKSSHALSLASSWLFSDYLSVGIQDNDLKVNLSTMNTEASGVSSSLSNSMGRRAPLPIPCHAASHLQRLSVLRTHVNPNPLEMTRNQQCS
jgi:hypothetical protein